MAAAGQLMANAGSFSLSFIGETFSAMQCRRLQTTSTRLALPGIADTDALLQKGNYAATCMSRKKATSATRKGRHELRVKAAVTDIDRNLRKTAEEPNPTPKSNVNYGYRGKSYFPLPVIDLKGLDDSDPAIRANLVEQIRDAGKEIGVICVVNHGIPIDVLDGIKEASTRFFDLPLEEKMKSEKVKEECHIRPVGFQQQSTNLTQKGFVTLRREIFEVQGIPAVTRNLTPWPEAVPEFKKYAEAISDGVFRLSCWLCDALSEGLGLPPDRFRKNWGGAYHQQLITAYYYPVSSQIRDPSHIGIGAHSDGPFFNVVIQDEVGGLQVFLDGEWKDTTPVPDGILFFIGDPIECVSNGEYQSTVHRVLSPETTYRFSCINTFEPFDKTTVVTPQPELGPAKYKPYVYGERLQSVLAQRFDPAIMTKNFMLIDKSTIDETRNFSYRDGLFRLGGVPLGDIAQGY